jgi:hypothetical protein
LAGTPEQPNGRSLYPFFLSPSQENGIFRRLTVEVGGEERAGDIAAGPHNVLTYKPAPKMPAPALA